MPADNRHCLLSVPLLSERKHLVKCCQARHIPKEEENNPPPLKSLPPNRREPGIAREGSAFAADKSDPPNVQLIDYGWEVKEREHVMPAICREPAAPSKLMDVTSCGC